MWITKCEFLELDLCFYEFYLIGYRFSKVEKVLICYFYYMKTIPLNCTKLVPEAG
jgi:hypothetical protein